MPDDNGGRGVPGSLRADRKHMFVRRPHLPKLPSLGIVTQLRSDFQIDEAVAFQAEAEFLERYRDSHATRLDIGLFEGPVLKEAVKPSFAGQPAQFGKLRRCEDLSRHLKRIVAHKDIFHVDTQGATSRDAYDDQTCGMRDVEAEIGRALALGINFRTSKGIGREHPCIGINGLIPRQHRANERARDQVSVPVLLEVKPLLLSPFVRIEQQPIFDGALTIDMIGCKPEMNLVWWQADQPRDYHAASGIPGVRRDAGLCQ
ncbi:MAG TPA: hypothetical protein VN024_26485 [Bradyrhizobium sp.]|nr:hypothetical protein [Bradyrhizobium sp.]HWX62031.1 hypothetical protein [Bradyrhizobium sp.]